ncbi:stage II sporulation protein M [Paenibacillus faecalis]|uniref:stage II sporulation protein M n=1 Tax=Paenibacillus faecalis TaxID=2079532 RepID=UPI000D0F17CF|nr:stage II sporulation protein M [Paenibacillus faecalis]
MFRFRTFIKDLSSIRVSLIISALLFAMGITVGWVQSGAIQELILEEIKKLGGISKKLMQSEAPELSFFIIIFLNNSIKSILVLFSGILFGIFPIVFLVMNGLFIGFLLNLEHTLGGNLSEMIFKGLLPHGIIEIPVLLIAAAYGLSLGGLVFKSIVARDGRGSGISGNWRDFGRKSVTASLWIVVLLFVAAVIESTITLWLMS